MLAGPTSPSPGPMLLSEATAAENAVRTSSPEAARSSVSADDAGHVHEEIGEHREHGGVADRRVGDLHRVVHARVDGAQELAEDLLEEDLSARIILMPPPVEPEQLTKLDRNSMASGAKIGHCA